MKFLLITLVLAVVCAQEMVVTREYTDYLRQHVDWEVMDYEDNAFRGWTMEEAKQLLMPLGETDNDDYYPSVEIKDNLPSSLSWEGASCTHPVRSQGKCASSWAFATAGMLSDRCCLQGTDRGWLSPQELVSCDKKTNKGCNGGWPVSAILNYVIPNRGLVPEACFPYEEKDKPCSRICADRKNWAASHVCDCANGFTYCEGTEAIKTCLRSGPTTIAFGICRSFYDYRSGLYKCDCGSNYLGILVVDLIGYSSDRYTARNSWGIAWGNQGFFDIASDTCKLPVNYRNLNGMCEIVK